MQKAEKINNVTINTRHFIASVDVQNRTFVIYGDFSDTEIMTLEDEGQKLFLFGDLIAELRDLEAMIRRMLPKEDG